VLFSTTDLLTSCGLREGRKSIFRAFASFAAVRNEKFTSSCSTFVMYGLDTFIRRASSVCEIPSSFMRSKICRRNADPILSMVVMGFILVEVQSRSRTVVVFSRVEVEMERNGFHLGNTSRPGPRDPRQETIFDSQQRIKSRTLERILSFAASQSKSINIFGIGIISASTKYERLLNARAGFV